MYTKYAVFRKNFKNLQKDSKCETQNQAVLVRVVSRGKGCARKNTPKIYTRHCGKYNGESQYFVKINQILMVRQAENFM